MGESVLIYGGFFGIGIIVILLSKVFGVKMVIVIVGLEEKW